MKKLITLIVTFCMCISLVACSSPDGSGNQDNGKNPTDKGDSSQSEQQVSEDNVDAGNDNLSEDEMSGENSDTSHSDNPASIDEDVYAQKISGDEAASQIQLIADNSSVWIPAEDELSYNSYSYAITDLDFNGRLEIIVSSCQGTGFFTYSNIWQVNDAEDGLEEVSYARDEEYSQPDIITDTADVYLNVAFDEPTYNYIFEDYLRNGAAENYSTLMSINMYGTSVYTNILATRQSVYDMDGNETTTYEDKDGNEITAEEYSAAPGNTFSACIKLQASFGWIHDSETPILTLENDTLVQKLSESYDGFNVA